MKLAGSDGVEPAYGGGMPTGRRSSASAGRAAALALLAAFLAVAVLAVAAVNAASERFIRTIVGDDGHRRVIDGDGQLIRFDGAGAEAWWNRYRAERLRTHRLRLQLRRERRILLTNPDVVEAINLAAATYGHSAELWSKARCETGGTFSPRSLNSSSGASGLFQFLYSTWSSTPYARFSVWSPYANALAAGWMHANGRGGEWSCR